MASGPQQALSKMFCRRNEGNFEQNRVSGMCSDKIQNLRKMDNSFEDPAKISLLNKTKRNKTKQKHANKQNFREVRDRMGNIKCNFSEMLFRC